MNKEDIIRFGEQADEVADRKIAMRGEYHPDWHQVRDEAFAKLVAAHEREAAAKECETLLPSKRIFDHRYYDAVEDCVAAIRARGEK